MLEILGPTIGFVSASLVVLIALGFGTMLVFFSGSALIVLGQFLPFVNHRLALLSGAFAVAVTAVVGWSVLDPALWWVLPFWQAVTTAVLYGFVLLRPLHRLLLRSFGAVLLLCGLTFAVSLALPSLADAGRLFLKSAMSIASTSEANSSSTTSMVISKFSRIDRLSKLAVPTVAYLLSINITF